MSATAADTMQLAAIDLHSCPNGAVMDPGEPDQRIEERCFAGWSAPLGAPPRWQRPSGYRVVPDGDLQVLEHVDKQDRCLVTGEPLWADYVAERVPASRSPSMSQCKRLAREYLRAYPDALPTAVEAADGFIERVIPSLNPNFLEFARREVPDLLERPAGMFVMKR